MGDAADEDGLSGPTMIGTAGETVGVAFEFPTELDDTPPPESPPKSKRHKVVNDVGKFVAPAQRCQYGHSCSNRPSNL